MRVHKRLRDCVESHRPADASSWYESQGWHIIGIDEVATLQVLAFELGSHNIRVNCIAPGIFQSGVSEETWEKVKDNSKMVPMRRWGEAEDLTALAVLLASNASEYITGTCLLVDGRLTLGMTPLVT